MTENTTNEDKLSINFSEVDRINYLDFVNSAVKALGITINLNFVDSFTRKIVAASPAALMERNKKNDQI